MIVPGLILVNTANTREHWSKRARRAKAHRWTSYVACRSRWPGHHWRDVADDGLEIRLTRYHPPPPRGRPMDTDGLAIAFKAVRDGIADYLRIDDGDARLVWAYSQQRGHEYAIGIELIPREVACAEV